jgi:bifunctional non-homologous end joining protein LigD
VTKKAKVLTIAGREVSVTNPEKTFFPEAKITKLDLVSYYLGVAEGALTGCRDRPTTLYRWPNGVAAPDDAFFQKRIPKHRPEWLETATVHFPSGRSAEMLVVADAAHLAWMVNLGCIDVNPWPVRKGDLDHPDELRIDLDPNPGVPFEWVTRTALVARDVLAEHSLTGFPKTSGKRGMHVYVRIESRWSFTEVRRAALALARAVEERVPEISTTAWWKEERHGVFIDYNQNARDRTIASAYSVRQTPDGRVSYPLAWDEVPAADPAAFRIDTVPQRYADIGDPGSSISDEVGSLESLLELAARQEEAGAPEAPWPPHFPKGEREPTRAAPSRRRRST